MRKLFALSIIATLVIMLVLSLSIPAAHAKDVVIKAQVTSVTEALDKNGSPYIRIIVEESRGIAYTSGVQVMAFSEIAGQVKGLKAGDTLHVIAAKRTFQGRDSYTILKVIN